MERSWENTVAAGTPDGQHGSLSVRMDTKDSSKNLNETFHCFHRYIL